ncbi:1,2-dihydroxy-3-keto-5-methylthiopentene dioxygenase [Tilletia horrida]|nr:1,2-dihydroxy-3-keto-5-methylthiopentene dioxygenase [Tilletia horrida]
MRSVEGQQQQQQSQPGSSQYFTFQQHHFQQQQQQQQHQQQPTQAGQQYAQPAPFPNSQPFFRPNPLNSNNHHNNNNMVIGAFHQYQPQQGGPGAGMQGQQQQIQGQPMHPQVNNQNNPGSQGSDGSGNGAMPGQPGYGGPGSTAGASGNGAAPNPPEYTLAGILHFLQSEWRRYERDRNEWEIERAEMRARIALLEGERRGAENLKTDLMRRVKMLEFALRQERSKYLAQNTTGNAPASVGSPGQTMAAGTPGAGPPGVLAKHPLVQGVTAEKASSSGRSSPVARSEDFGAASATFQGHPLRGPSNLATNSFTASSLTFGGTGSGAASTVLFNPAGAGSTMSFNSANAPNASMLSRHTSLARDGKSRAKSRDYLKQCLSEISYLTNPATLNPLNERAYISGAVGFTPGAQQSNGAAGTGATNGGALGLAPLGAGAASAGAQGQQGAGGAAGFVNRPRKVMYEDVGQQGNGGAPPPLPPPPPPPPSLPNQSLPTTQQGQPAAPSAPGFVAHGGGLDRAAPAGADPGLPELGSGAVEGSNASAIDSATGAASDPLGVSSQTTGPNTTLSGETAAVSKQPEIHIFSPADGAAQEGSTAPVEDAAELMPAPSPSGATPVVPDVPAPTADVGAEHAGGDDALSSSSASTEGDDDRASDRSSASSSTTVEEENGQAGAAKGADAQQQVEGSEAGHFFEQRSGGAASRPDRMSFDSDGRPLPSSNNSAPGAPSSSSDNDEGVEVEREIEDEVDDDELAEEQQRTAIYRPGGVPPTGGIADATADDWRRLREAGAMQRLRRERERLARQAAEGGSGNAASAADSLADVRAHLAETTERVNALQASEGSGAAGAGAAAAARPPLVRTSSGRADEDELANLKLDPVPDDEVPATRRRARAGSALSAATSSEAVPDTQPWKAKRVLRGHLDAVRAVAFDTVEANVLSGGDDCTIKYWRLDAAALQAGSGAGGAGGRDGSFSSLRSGGGGGSIGAGGPGGAAGNSAADYPIVTFRGHTEPVTCLAVSPPFLTNNIDEDDANGRRRKIYSGSLDATIRVWQAPHEERASPYPEADSTVELGALVGHTDAVWDLTLFSHLGLLVSVAADGMTKVWSTTNGVRRTFNVGPPPDTSAAAMAGTLKLSWDYFGLDPEDSAAVEAERAAFSSQAQAEAEKEGGAGAVRNGGLPVPTSVDICHSNIRLCAVGYTNAVVKLFDVTTGKEVKKLQSEDTQDASSDAQINCVVTHPTLPILFTAHEDGHIRMFDLNTGACTMSMVGHLDSVTTLDIDPAGLTLVSGGHDCSVRFWDIMGGGAGDGLTPSSGSGDAASEDESTSKATAAATAAAAVSVRDACVQEITSHRKKAEEGVLGVRYCTGAPFFASAGADGVVRLFG